MNIYNLYFSLCNALKKMVNNKEFYDLNNFINDFINFLDNEYYLFLKNNNFNFNLMLEDFFNDVIYLFKKYLKEENQKKYINFDYYSLLILKFYVFYLQKKEFYKNDKFN